MTGKVAPKVTTGLMGKLMETTRPQPTHKVRYPPHMKDAPHVRKARARVSAGQGSRKVDLMPGKSRWA